MVNAACWQKTINEDEGWSHSQVPCGTRLLGNGQEGEECSIKGQMCQEQKTREMFRDLCDVESATLGRTQDENSRLCVKSKKEKKEARISGPPDSSISLCTECTTVQVCGDSKVVEKWINETCAMGPKDREQMNSIQRTLHSLWRRKVAHPVGQVDDYVRRVL